MATYVMVFGRLHRLEEKEVFEAEFEKVSRILLQKVPGVLRDELIQDSSDPHSYIMLSEWVSKEAWATWQRAPIHEEQVGHLQNYWKGQGVKIFNTTFSVGKEVSIPAETL